MRILIKILFNVGLFLWKLLLVLKSIVAVLWKPVAKPGRIILRFFYYALIFPLYRLYLILGKKLGLSQSKRGRRLQAIFVNKKLVHFLVAILAGVLVAVNFLGAQTALSSEELVGKTLLAKIVTDELTQSEDLIEDHQQAAASLKTPGTDFWSAGAYWQAPLAMNYNLSEDNFIPDSPRPAHAPTRTETIEYTVKQGDTISSIAQYFGISVNTILWANNLTINSYIRPGNVLTILPVSGVTYTVARGDSLSGIAKKFDIDQTEILNANNLQNGNQVKIGQDLIIPGGRRLINQTVAGAPRARSLAQIIAAPRDSIAPVSGNKLNWPAKGRITQYYSWRHTGLDVANKIGTPIYAADAGTVVEVSFNRGGYGNQIIVDHGGGKKTRYAHLSKYGTKVGAEVAKGQFIGEMGSTGRSTGSHLHFEVMIGGKRYNPLSYLY